MEKTAICCQRCLRAYAEKIRPRVLPCGHSYCTHCIEDLLEDLFEDRHLSCPSCKKDHRIASTGKIPFNHELERCLQEITSMENRQKTAKSTEKSPVKSPASGAGAPPSASGLEVTKSQLGSYAEFLRNKEFKMLEVAGKIRDLANRQEVIVEEVREERKKINEMLRDGVRSVDVRDKLPSLYDLEERVGVPKGFPERCQLGTPEAEYDDPQQFDDVRREPEKWKKNIESGCVFAVSTLNGRRRNASLSTRDGKIYLHCLRDGEVPPGARTMKHSEVLSSLNKDSTEVFLDVGWEGSCQGRVHILLSPDTLLARHFRILCTGDAGPSYARTRFHEVSYKDESRECIRGGDYELGDGTGGAALFDGLDKMDGVYNRQWETGVVYATRETSDLQRAQFAITTGCGFSDRFYGVFGKVLDGIDILKEAVARFRNIREVEIVDCGVVLPI